MPNLENKIAIIRDVRLKGLAQLRENASSPEKDRTGSASNMVASALRLLAVSEYHLNHDVSNVLSIDPTPENLSCGVSEKSIFTFVKMGSEMTLLASRWGVNGSYDCGEFNIHADVRTSASTG
jgi:hypothetical protein